MNSMFFHGILMVAISLVCINVFPSELNPVLLGSKPHRAEQSCDLQSAIYSPATLEHLEKISSARRSADQWHRDGSVLIEADSVVSDGQGNWVADGHVHVRNAHDGIFADRAEFSEANRIARFFGNVLLYTKDGHPLSAENMQIDIDMFKGAMMDNAQIHIVERASSMQRQNRTSQSDSSLFSDGQDNQRPWSQSNSNYQFWAKAIADKIEINGENYHVFHNAVMTACPGDDPDVTLMASQVELDHERRQGRAQNLVVRFKNVPIFFFPKVYFPISSERMTGFLFPRVGYQRRSGLILSLPYYLNLHPQYDATITPSIISKRGLQIRGETRYITENSEGVFQGEVLPDDDILNDDRHAFSYRHRQSYFDSIELAVDWEKISDTEYRSDFADNVDSRASVFSRQTVNFSYNDQSIRASVRAMGHELASSHFQKGRQPYDLLPEFRLQLNSQKVSVFELGGKAELTRYRHEVDSTDGTRLRFIPHLSLPVRKIYGYLEPKFALHSIRYDLSDRSNNRHGEYRVDENIPVWSIDSGLYFERNITLGGKDHLQTLEPRMFYLDIPVREKQLEFPEFDTGIGNGNSFSHYFRENRFFGGDRVGDTRQVTAGLTSRFIDQGSGKQIGKISVGQVYYFEDRQIGMHAEAAIQKNESSDLLLEFDGALNNQWEISGFTSWSDELDEFSYISLLSRYQAEDGISSSEAGYIQDADQREYLKLDHDSEFANNWLYRVRFHYSILDDQFQFAEISNTYLNCCWSFGVNLQRYQNDGRNDNRVMISFGLKGLGGS
ncbi:MAG: LPS assembly protein LptD [Gammaproteobacteria bacterium]|nr:LPS assembly protein LptD [Gammaproteobacteria bacterium]